MVPPPQVSKRPTLRTVAAEAQVSIATVSYVLSGRTGGRPGVSDATAERVRAAVARVGYRPNQAARAIRTGRTNLVLLSLTMLADPWTQAVADAVNLAVVPSGLTPLVLADGDWWRVLEQHNADATFIDAVEDTPECRQRLRTLAERGARLVVFSETLEPDGYDVISSPDLPGCDQALQHLLVRHTRIACLTSQRALDLERRTRYDVYTDALANAGIERREDYTMTYELDAVSAFNAADRLLHLPEPPSAIFCTSDFAAISAVHAAQRLQMRVPEDVAIIGAGNTLAGARMAPSLSSVGPDSSFFDRLATILHGRATGSDTSPPTRHVFDWSLFARETTHHTGE